MLLIELLDAVNCSLQLQLPLQEFCTVHESNTGVDDDTETVAAQEGSNAGRSPMKLTPTGSLNDLLSSVIECGFGWLNIWYNSPGGYCRNAGTACG